jgi:hypothetical protein
VYCIPPTFKAGADFGSFTLVSAIAYLS